MRKLAQPTAKAAINWRESGVLTPATALSCAAARRCSRVIPGHYRPLFDIDRITVAIQKRKHTKEPSACECTMLF